MRVHEAMRTNPIKVTPETAIAEARAIAEERGVRHLIVAVGQRVLGVVEEDGLWLAAEDVLRTAAGLQGSLTAREARPVRSAMRPVEPAVSSHESLATAARVMLLKRRTAVPVIDGGHLVGILTVDECRRAVGAPVVVVRGPEGSEGADPDRDGRDEDDIEDHDVA